MGGAPTSALSPPTAHSPGPPAAPFQDIARCSTRVHVLARCSSRFHVLARCSSRFHVLARCSSRFHVLACCSSRFHVLARCSSRFHVLARCSSRFHVLARCSTCFHPATHCTPPPLPTCPPLPPGVFGDLPSAFCPPPSVPDPVTLQGRSGDPRSSPLGCPISLVRPPLYAHFGCRHESFNAPPPSLPAFQAVWTVLAKICPACPGRSPPPWPRPRSLRAGGAGPCTSSILSPPPPSEPPIRQETGRFLRSASGTPAAAACRPHHLG